MQSLEDIEAADESVGELTGTRQGPDETVSTRVGRVRREVEAVIEYADQSPNPDLKDLHKYVYAGDWEARG